MTREKMISRSATQSWLQTAAYAVVDFGFGTISVTLTRPENWCEALIPHLNVKYCRVIGRDERPVLSVAIGPFARTRNPGVGALRPAVA